MARLTLETADSLATAALDEARRRKLQPTCVAVLDAGGHLVVLKRETDAGNLRPQIAMGKATGALGMGFDSREIGQRAAQAPAFFAAVAALGPLVPSAGGVLLRDGEGEVIGAVGISGDKPDEDEACAFVGMTAAGLGRDAEPGLARDAEQGRKT